MHPKTQTLCALIVVGVEEEAVVVAVAGAGHRKTSQYNSSTVRVAGEEEEAAVVAPAPFWMAKTEAWPPPPRPSSPVERVEPAVGKVAMSAGSEKGSSSHREKKTAKYGSWEKSGRSKPR